MNDTNSFKIFEIELQELVKRHQTLAINVVVNDTEDESVHIMGNMCAACAMEELAHHVMFNMKGLHTDGKMAMVTEIDGIKQ